MAHRNSDILPPVWLVMLTLGLLFASGFAFGGAGDPDRGPAPFDPLSTEEQDRAVATAEADPRVALLLSGDHVVIGAALATDKARLLSDPAARLADVWFYNYATDQTVWAVVDLRAKAVDSVSLAGFQPPLTTGESARAIDMAQADPSVQEALDSHRPYEDLQATARLWTGETETACPKNRCVLVGFFVDQAFVHDLLVRVNLSAVTVDGLLSDLAAPAGLPEGLS